MKDYADWIPAAVGCHWTKGDYTISTYIRGKESGYALYRHREGEIGRYETFEGAAMAADFYRLERGV